MEYLMITALLLFVGYSSKNPLIKIIGKTLGFSMLTSLIVTAIIVLLFANEGLAALMIATYGGVFAGALVIIGGVIYYLANKRNNND